MNNNIYAQFESSFPENLHKLCLRSEQRSFSYANLIEEVARYASFLEDAKTQPGDRVLVQVAKSPENLFLYLACLKCGLVYLPLNLAYLEDEVRYFIADSEPTICVCDPGAATRFEKILQESTFDCGLFTLTGQVTGSLIDHIDNVTVQASLATADMAENDTAVIIYTSGTTGKPKGAMITHGNLVSNGNILKDAWGWQPDDVMLHTLPVFHVHGLFLGCHLPLLSGASMIFEEKFSVERIVDELPNATVYMGVPTHYTRLIDSGDLRSTHCRNMRLFTSGSAPLLAQTFEDFQELTGHTILERYGMTETGMNTSNPLNGTRKPGTVGPGLPAVEIRVVDIDNHLAEINTTGNLEVKGPNVFTGYWRNPEKTQSEFTEDGFFRTGDLAQIDADGYITIVGRSKDLIISGGLNVYPKEIESIIDELDGVLESAVIATPDADFGEAVTAIIVADGSIQLSEQSVIKALKERVANFKVAKRVHFVDELPRNTMGKVQKNLLRETWSTATSSD